MKKRKIVKLLRSDLIQIRVTPGEHEEICRKANCAGKSVSDYGRQAILRRKVYARLTEKQCEALNSLTDARADMVNIINALRGVPESLKKQLFGDLTFMERWIQCVNKLIQRCNDVLEHFCI